MRPCWGFDIVCCFSLYFSFLIKSLLSPKNPTLKNKTNIWRQQTIAKYFFWWAGRGLYSMCAYLHERFPKSGVNLRLWLSLRFRLEPACTICENLFRKQALYTRKSPALNVFIVLDFHVTGLSPSAPTLLHELVFSPSLFGSAPVDDDQFQIPLKYVFEVGDSVHLPYWETPRIRRYLM